jgi:hypothetical protein
MRLKARAYTKLALEVIPLAQSADDLRSWWEGERNRRDEYGLTDSQTDQLVEACKEHVRSLGEQVRE